MRIAVLGSGAMGSIFGTYFARAGADIIFFDRRADVIEAINGKGLLLEGLTGPETLRFRATQFPSELGKVDLALVLVNSGATAEVADVAAECLLEHGCALTLQNGIGNWEALAARLGRHRVLAGSTYNSGAGLGPGHARHTNLGPTVIGELDGSMSERVNKIGELMLEVGLPVEVSNNVQGHIWSKFVHNCAINPISAVTGLRPGEIARTKSAALLLDRLLDEVLSVVDGLGIKLPEDDPREQIRDHCWERYNRPSMLQHIENGQKTEIDSLNGALVHRAREINVHVPVNEAIVYVVKSLEANASRAATSLDEAGLEKEARSSPRGSRWG